MLVTRLARLRDRRHRQERGAAAIVLALVITAVVIPLGALTVDIGMQRVARRDMQAIADTTAINMAARLAAGQSITDSDATTANLSTGSVGSAPVLHAYLGYIAPGTLQSNQARGCGASPYVGGFQDPTVAGQAANAVLVTASTTVQFGLANALPRGGVGSGAACRSAVSQAKPSGCFSIGSFALGIETGNAALLGALLNDNLGISGQVVGYQGLADADVTVGDLVAAANVGTVSELANVKASTLYGELAGTQIGDTAALQLLGLIGGSAKLDPNLTVGDMIDLTGAGADVLDSSINLLDLVSSSLAISNGTHFIDAGSAVSVPGLLGLKIGLQVIERPRMACGAGQASTGQVRLQITGSVAGLINLDLGVVLAQAKGRITDIACTAGAPTTMTVQTSDQALVALDVTASVLSGTPATPSPTQVVGSGSSYPIPLTEANYDDGYATNSGAVLVPKLTLGLLGIDLGVVSNLVVSPLLATLSPDLTTFLTEKLGITVAGAKIWPQRTPNCGQPMLVG